MTTLVEELTQAAEDADLLAEVQGSEHWRQRAARLRARIDRLRELHVLVFAQDYNGGRRDLFNALTGPIPAQEPTDTQGDRR